MTMSGNIYGVVLNDAAEQQGLQQEFSEKPYAAPPQAPVVYMKPASCLASAATQLEPGTAVSAAATLALLFARDACRVDPGSALEHVGAAALALDLSYPRKDYYRPAIAQQNADGFLALGQWMAPGLPDTITTTCDDAACHEWSLDRLVRDPAALIAALSEFMTLQAGDVLLVGLPGDAPLIEAGSQLTVTARNFADLQVNLVEAST